MTRPAARQLPSTPQPAAAARVAAVPASVPVRLYTIAEAARVLRVPEGWLRKKVSAGVVPHTRLGKHVRFTDDHLLRIVAEGDQEPATGPATGVQGLSPRARRPRPAT
jgi:excisionase family DNA binding protein